MAAHIITTTTTQVTPVSRVPLPFARSIPIVHEVTGMKPFTTIYGFINNRSINANITQSAQLTITGAIGNFLGYKDVSPGNSSSQLRQVTRNTSAAKMSALYPKGTWMANNVLPKGEIIRFYATPTTIHTALVISQERQLNAATRVVETVLHVLLMRVSTTATANTDNFLTMTPSNMPLNATIRGDISGATGLVSNVFIPVVGTMNTNSMGNYFGMYTIPPGEVRTGAHQIEFSDSSINDTPVSETDAAATFTSFGELETVKQTVNRFITTTLPRVVWYDPLAETFIIPADKRDGCYATSVDLFFQQKVAGETQPVVVQLTETLNGYPSNRVLFNAEASLPPGSITVSKNASIATNFKFKGPVFLQPGVEYCIKVLTNSVNYRVWISQIGEASIQDPTKMISKQPYLGVLFKSQNNSTWTADQLQDLMFRLKYAKFDTSRSGLVTVQNQSDILNPATMPSNPFMTANGSTIVKVLFPKHGLFVGALVDFAGSSVASFNARFKVVSVIDSSRFTITAASQTIDGLQGGPAVTATKNIKYDSLTLDISEDFSIVTGTGVTTTVRQSTAGGKDTKTLTTAWNKLTDQDAPRYIMSDVNEAAFLGGRKSLDSTINIYSRSSDLSPVINRNNISAILYSNQINSLATIGNTSVDNTAVDSRIIISALAGVTFTSTTNTISIPDTVDVSLFKIGAFITTSGAANAGNNVVSQITNIDTSVSPFLIFTNATGFVTETVATTIVQRTGFIDEISPAEGTAEAKYLTDEITLKDTATALQVMFAASIPAAADVRLYYRVGVASGRSLKTRRWVPVTMSYKKSQPGIYLEQEYKLNALPGFNTAQFKLVMLSTDTSQVPKIKDFRAILLA